MKSSFLRSHTNLINKPVTILIITAMVLSLVAAAMETSPASAKSKKAKKLPRATNMASKASSRKIAAKLKKAGLSNTRTFRKWVRGFNKTVGKGAGLTAKWRSPFKLKYDTAKMADRWEKKYSYSDANCRMTALLLLGPSIKAKKLGKKYDGTYLMFDEHAIKNVKKYKYLKKKLRLFTTLYGEKKAKNAKAAKRSLAKAWKKYGIRVKNKKAKLVSVLIYDAYDKVTFVGHAGVLLKTGKNYLFVEKIAFEQPYQVTKVKNLKQLKKVLGARPEYFGGPGEPGPYLYLNGKYKGVIKKTA